MASSFIPVLILNILLKNDKLLFKCRYQQHFTGLNEVQLLSFHTKVT